MFSARKFTSIFILSLFFALLVSLGMSTFIHVSPIKTKKNQQTPQNIQLDLLLSNIKGTNSLLRRDAIIALGNNKMTEAITPLFSMLMDASTSETEIGLISYSLYQITNGKIFSYVIKLLAETYKKTPPNNQAEEKKGLSIEQTIRLIRVLAQMTPEVLEKEKLNLDFFSFLLDIHNNDLSLVSLELLGQLRYEPLYKKIQGLYSENFFLKIPIIKTMTKIALNYEKYQKNATEFIIKAISEETHPNVQEENYLSLYMLTQHLLKISEETEMLVKKIVGLNSSSLELSMQQEKYLVEQPFSREQVSLVQFFLSDFISARLKNRLLNILLFHHDLSFLDKNWLLKNIQGRNFVGPSYLELAKTSLLVLGKRIERKEELGLLLSYLQERRMTFSVISSINTMIKESTHIDFLRESLWSIKNIIFMEEDMVGWVAYVFYKVKGLGELKSLLDTQGEKGQSIIFHALSGCQLPLEEKKELIQIYGERNSSEHFQQVLVEMREGKEICYFG